MQVPGTSDFRSQDIVEVRFRHIDQTRILDHRRAMYDTAQWRHFALHASQQLGNLVRIGDIDSKFANSDTLLPQVPKRQSCIGRGGYAPPDERKMTGTFPYKPLSGRKAEPAAAAGDEIARRGRESQPGFGPVRDDRGTINPVHRQNNLADMARMLHAAEGFAGSR